jgi:hypothetical protein
MGNVAIAETRIALFSVFKNKGAGERDLQLLRAQPLVRRRVLVMATRLGVFFT